MKIKTIIAAIALMAIPVCASAQSTKADEQLSEELKHEINILKADIKALKARKKADPTNVEFATEMSAKSEKLKEVTKKKKVIDNAVKANKKHAKEVKQADKAIQQNDKAQKAADRVRETSQNNGKSNELLSDELKSKIEILNADIKSLNARKKANKNDASVAAQLSQKKVELKEAKRQKKIFDKAIGAEKKAKKEVRQAEKAKDRMENAYEKRNEIQ